MNRLTKTAAALGLAGFGILLLILLSGIGHPNPLFTFGTLTALTLMFAAIVLYVIGWIVDLKDAVAKRNLIGVSILVFAAALWVIPVFIKYILS